MVHSKSPERWSGRQLISIALEWLDFEYEK